MQFIWKRVFISTRNKVFINIKIASRVFKWLSLCGNKSIIIFILWKRPCPLLLMHRLERKSFGELAWFGVFIIIIFSYTNFLVGLNFGVRVTDQLIECQTSCRLAWHVMGVKWFIVQVYPCNENGQTVKWSGWGFWVDDGTQNVQWQILRQSSVCKSRILTI